MTNGLLVTGRALAVGRASRVGAQADCSRAVDAPRHPSGQPRLAARGRRQGRLALRCDFDGTAEGHQIKHLTVVYESPAGA